MKKLYFKFQTKIPLSNIGHLSSRIHIIPYEGAKKKKGYYRTD